MSHQAADWDEAAAAQLEGATVLIGLTYAEPSGDRHEQFYGTVMRVDASEGITLRLEGHRAGETFRLPPDLNSFEPAASGRYTLRENGDVVDDPDYTACWTIAPPQN